jgi:hypothetical protein
MVRDAVQGVTAEAEAGHGRAERPSQIVRRCPLGAELRADRAHRFVQLGDRAPARAGEDEAGRGVVGEIDEQLRTALRATSLQGLEGRISSRTAQVKRAAAVTSLTRAAIATGLQQQCFIVRDGKGQALTYVYFEEEPGRRAAAKLLTRDEARRIAANVAKLGRPIRARVSSL